MEIEWWVLMFFNQKIFMGILEKIGIICLILDIDSFIEKLLNRSFLIIFH